MSMTSIAPTPIAAPARGWFRRNWKWFIPSMFLGAIFLAAVALFGYTQIRSYGYRSNPTYQMAIAAVQESPQAQARLGDPIVDSGWFPQGRIDITGNLGFDVWSNRPVSTLVMEALPNTLILGMAALATALAIGVPGGMKSPSVTTSM